jgi:Fe2+ or Zn2+ uptake regulation protein
MLEPMTKNTTTVSPSRRDAAIKIALRKAAEPLTETEREILRALENAIREFDNPSLKEIAMSAGRGDKASTVYNILRTLEIKGYVEMPGTRGRPRGIRLLHKAVK